MIQKMHVRRKGDDPIAGQILARLIGFGFSNLTRVIMEKVFRVESDAGVDMEHLKPMFCNPIVANNSATTMLSPTDGPIREVCYKRGITDPETDSIFHGAEALGVSGITWARIATRYQFPGISEDEADAIIDQALKNNEVETIMLPGQEWDTLVPQGVASNVELIDLRDLSADELIQLSEDRRLFLSSAQMAAIRELGLSEDRAIRDGELEMTGAAWGDHCNHTTLKALGAFQTLQGSTTAINHPLVVSAYKDNSGVMRFYGGMALAMKGETHISPSSVATYGGIMTKHGGVIRDPMGTGKGAHLWAGTTIMGTCDPRMLIENVPQGALHPRTILLESIRGTKDYTNPMGIPMGWSQYMTHPGYVKCFALGHSLGILPENRAQKGEPVSGDYVVLIGGKTGRDGLHGATVSSGAMTHRTAEVDGAHVQIGMPIEERKFMEAVPVLRDHDCVRAITDCGAAGLASAVGEMFDQIGVWVNLAWVPLKCLAMAKWEILLSESQERMVLCISPNKLTEALAILAQYQVPATVIGQATNSKRFQAVFDPEIENTDWVKNPTVSMTGETVVDLPYSFLTQDCPLPEIEIREPQRQDQAIQLPEPQQSRDWVELVVRHLGNYDIADQSVAAHQYDQTVQGATVIPYTGGVKENMPDELMATTPILGQPYVAGIANAVNCSYGQLDPAVLGRLMMVQAMAKLVAAGFNPGDITCNVNLYTPRATDSPENAWRLKTLIESYAETSVDLGMPIISGKDSSSGTFWTVNGERIDAPLTLDVLSVGRMPDRDRLIPKAFAKPGDHIVLYYPGLRRMGLGGSALLKTLGQVGQNLTDIDPRTFLAGMKAYYHMLADLNWSQHIHSRSVVAEGGLIRRLLEMCIGNNLGCDISLGKHDPFSMLFAELHGGIVFATDTENWRQHLTGQHIELGTVTKKSNITVHRLGAELFSCPTNDLAEQWSKTFAEVAI